MRSFGSHGPGEECGPSAVALRGRAFPEGVAMKKLMLPACVAGLAFTGIAAVPAAAEERSCRGSIGAVTVDNLRVPQGATCTLNGTRVKGTVKVERAATLHASKIRVVGSVQAENHKQVNISGSAVGGSIQVKQGGGSSLSTNTVNGDVQYFTNRGTITIRSNRIDGNLQCKENQPAPTGGGNVVQGNKEDQCRRL